MVRGVMNFKIKRIIQVSLTWQSSVSLYVTEAKNVLFPALGTPTAERRRPRFPKSVAVSFVRRALVEF
jgi:hypothetical protein